jgi:hypothetical protein
LESRDNLLRHYHGDHASLVALVAHVFEGRGLLPVILLEPLLLFALQLLNALLLDLL